MESKTSEITPESTSAYGGWDRCIVHKKLIEFPSIAASVPATFERPPPTPAAAAALQQPPPPSLASSSSALSSSSAAVVAPPVLSSSSSLHYDWTSEENLCRWRGVFVHALEKVLRQVHPTLMATEDALR